MSVRTSKALYRQHAYSGSRKSLKRVRGALKSHHGEDSRLKVWRSGEPKKKPVKQETSKENSFTQNTLKTYALAKSKTSIEATDGAPNTLKVEFGSKSEITDSFQFVNCALSTSIVTVEPISSEMPDSLQCVNCGIHLKQLQRHWMAEESEELQQLLSGWIFKEIEDNDALCIDCYSLLHQALESDDKSRRLGHEEVCLPCGRSLHQNWKSPSLSSYPKLKKAIAQWTPSHQVRNLDAVCWKCYQKARHQVEITNSEVHSKVKSQGEEVKMEPSESLLGNGELDILASQDTQLDEEEIPDKHPQPVFISLATHKRAADTSSRCIFKNCRYSDRLVPSRSIKERLLIDYSFYLPSNACVCSQHQINSHKEWSDLVSSCSITDFTAAHLEDLLSILKDTTGNKYCRNFDNLIKQDDILCQYLMGIEYKKYEEIIKDIEPIRKQVRNLKNALAMYLMKKHTGFSDEKVANFFGVGVKLLVNSVDKVHAHFESVVATDESYENLPTLGVDENGEIVYYMICE